MFSRFLSQRCKSAIRRLSTKEPGKIVPGQDGVKRFEEMPGPPSLPELGTLYLYRPPFDKYSFQNLAKTYTKMNEEYGDVVREVMTKERTIVHLFNPDDMSTAYKACGRNPYRQSHFALAKYRAARPDLYDNPGVIPSNGEKWRQFRSVFQPLLFGPMGETKVKDMIEEVANDLVKAIRHGLDKNEIDILPLLKRYGLETMGYLLLNKRMGCLSEQGNPDASALIQANENNNEAVYLTENQWEYAKNYKLLEESQDIFAAIVKKYFDEALKNINSEENKTCLLHRMMKIDNVNPKDVFTMVVDMFMGGIDTTATTLTFALYHMARWRRVQDATREHLYNVMPTKEDSAVTGMRKNPAAQRYIAFVRREVLRLNPTAVGTGRFIEEDLVLGGYFVPANTMCILQHQVASLQEKNFKHALVFEPERWIHRSPLDSVSSPFGVSPRNCIGMKIAERELDMAIAKIIRHYEVNYYHEDVGLTTKLLHFPDRPVRLHFTETNDEEKRKKDAARKEIDAILSSKKN